MGKFRIETVGHRQVKQDLLQGLQARHTIDLIQQRKTDSLHPVAAEKKSKTRTCMANQVIRKYCFTLDCFHQDQQPVLNLQLWGYALRKGSDEAHGEVEICVHLNLLQGNEKNQHPTP